MLFVNIGVKSCFEDCSLHVGGKIFPPVYCLLFCQLLAQANTNLNALNKSHLLMISAKGTYGIDDLVDLPQWFSVHEPVQLFKVGFDFLVIHAGGAVVGLVQQVQEVLVGWLLGGQMGLEGGQVLIHLHFSDPPCRFPAGRILLPSGASGVRFGLRSRTGLP